MGDRHEPTINHTCVSERLADELILVDELLRDRPRRHPPAYLRGRTMKAIRQEMAGTVESWEPLPPDVWMPALVFSLALVLALLLAPAPPVSLGAAAALEPTVANWPAVLRDWAESLATTLDSSIFLIGYSVAFAILAFWGLRMALTSWQPENTRTLGQVERDVAAAAERVLRGAKRAH